MVVWLLPTVTASTMIARFNCVRKVRCHKALVEIAYGSRRPSEPSSRRPAFSRAGEGSGAWRSLFIHWGAIHSSQTCRADEKFAAAV